MWDDEQERRSFLATTAALGGLALGSSGSAAAASTVRVDKSDPDAYDSIQRAVFNAPSGATIQIAPGRYTESFAIPKSKSLTIRGDTGGDGAGAGPDAPVIDGEGRVETGLFITGPSQNAITVEGLEFRNWGADLAPGESDDAITSYKRSNVTVRDTTIRNIAGKGVTTSDGGGEAAENWLIERCRFDSIARNGVLLGSLDGGVVRNNEFRSTEPVPDKEDAWWERDRPAGNPVYGVLVAANAGQGKGRVSDVTVEDNDFQGQFDAGAVGVLSYNYGGTDVLLESVTVRNNSINLEPLAYDEDELPRGRGNHGVRIDANSGRDNRLSAIRDVHVVGNDISGAGDGVITINWSRSQDEGLQGAEGVSVRENTLTNCKEAVRFTTYDGAETRDITVTGNETVDCRTGTIVYTGPGGRTSDVRITNNQFVDYDLGVIPWASGEEIDGVDIVDNDFVRNSEAAVDNIVYGVEPVAFGADVKNIRVSGSSFSNTRRGIAAFALNDSETNVVVEKCQFTDNRDGIGTFAFDEDSTVELHGEHLTFERNQVGARTGEKASGSNLHIHSSDFGNNTEYAAENRSGVGVIDATCNYWGDPTGPEHDSNRNGRGDLVSDGVDYDPLLPQSFEQVSGNACHPAGGNPNEHTGGSGRSENGAKPKGGGSPPEHAANSE